MFSQAQYEATIASLESGLTDLSTQMAKIGPAVNSACSFWLVPDWVADGIRWCGEKLLEIGSTVLRKIGELLEGAAAPVLFFIKAYNWHDTVGSNASAVASSVAPANLRAAYDWSGEAASDYSKAVATQTTAAAEIQSIAGQVATSLNICAAAGLTFYVALGVIIVQLIASFIAALVALGTVVFSWAGLALIVGEAGISTGMIITAVGALVALLGAQATQLIAIKGAASAQDAFPGGRWPQGTV